MLKLEFRPPMSKMICSLTQGWCWREGEELVVLMPWQQNLDYLIILLSYLVLSYLILSLHLPITVIFHSDPHCLYINSAMQLSWCCPPYSRGGDQGTGEIPAHSLSLPVLTLKESPSFTRDDLHCSDSSQAVKTSLHESTCCKKWGIFCLSSLWRKWEWLVKETIERKAELHPSHKVILPLAAMVPDKLWICATPWWKSISPCAPVDNLPRKVIRYHPQSLCTLTCSEGIK